MKKAIFTFSAIFLFSAGSFANEAKDIGDIGCKPGIKVNEKTVTAEIQNCKDRGGNCRVEATINGQRRVFYPCCNDIVVVVIVPAD